MAETSTTCARRTPSVPLRPKSRPGGAVGLRDASLRLGVHALIFSNIVSSDCRPFGRQSFSVVGQPSGRTSLPVKSGKRGSPAGAQRSGSCGERRSSGTDELSMQAGEGRDVELATTQGCTSCSWYDFPTTCARRTPSVPLRPKSRPNGAVGLRDASLRLGVQALIFSNIVSSDCRPFGRQSFSVVGQPSGRISL